MIPRRLGACLIAVAAVAAACPGGPAPRPVPREQPVRGGTLRLSIADDIGVLDPQLAAHPTAVALVRATQRGLMAFPASGDGAPEPDLAAAPPEVSADGLTYTFRLRDGAAFSAPAARPVTSADLKAGLERLFRLRAPLRRFFEAVTGAAAFDSGRASGLAGVTTPDERTVRIRLARPANDLLWMLAHPAAAAVPAGLPAAIVPQRLSASGPYRLGSYEPGRTIRLVRNPAWRAAADQIRPAYVDEIVATVGASPDADVVGEDLPVPTGGPRSVFRNGCLLYLFLNTAVRPLTDLRARLGVAAALDPRGIVEALRASPVFSGTPASGILTPGVVGYRARDAASPDPAKARALLGAGFGIRIGWERVGADATLDARAGAAVVAMLARAGVRASPLPSEGGFPTSIYERYETPAARVPMGIARWCADWPGRAGRSALGALLDGRRIPATGNTNYSLANDGVLNRLLDAATGEGDPGRIGRAWEAAERRALTLAAVVPLAFLDEVVVLSPRLRGFSPHTLFSRGDPTALWLAPA